MQPNTAAWLVLLAEDKSQGLYRQACAVVVRAMHCKDWQLDLSLAPITEPEALQDLVGSPCSDWANKIQLVADIVCNLSTTCVSSLSIDELQIYMTAT